MTRFVLYLARWQASTPVLWLVVSHLGAGLAATVLANLIGGAIFFWVDQFIFRNRICAAWEVQSQGACVDCGKAGHTRRLILAPGGTSRSFYDKRLDANPEFRCLTCSIAKIGQLKAAKRIASAVQAPGGFQCR